MSERPSLPMNAEPPPARAAVDRLLLHGRRWLPGLGAAMLLAVAWWAIYAPHAWAPRAWEPGRPLRIGYAVEAPYAFVDVTGRVSGEAPEIAREVAKRLGIEQVTWRQMEFGLLIEELREGTIDVIAAGMFVTEPRKRLVAFSRPTLRVRQGLLVQPGNPLGLASYEDVVTKGARVAVIANSFEERFFRRRMLGEESPVVVVSSSALGRIALEGGQADAFALSVPSLRWSLREQPLPGCEVIEQPEADLPSEVAFAFRREDEALQRAWNEALASFVGSETHVNLVDALGLSREDLPASPGRDDGGMER